MATGIRVSIAIIVLGVIGLILGIVFAIMAPAMLTLAIGLIVIGAGVAVVGFFLRGMMKARGEASKHFSKGLDNEIRT